MFAVYCSHILTACADIILQEALALRKCDWRHL